MVIELICVNIRPHFFLPVMLALLSGYFIQAGETSLEDLISVQEQVQASLKRAEMAIVAIECGGATATGVIVSPAGLVLTAAHVTGMPGRRIKITLHDGKSMEAKSLGLDTSTDAAMIQLPTPAKAWPYAPISRETRRLKVGEWCFALGHPGGRDAARGPVLRIGKLVKTTSNMLQSDCVLMGGDSGGGLFNLSGELIGIHSQIWRGRDQNLHVSMAPFLRSWEAMKKGETVKSWDLGNGAWIGLSTQGADEGLVVQAVAPESPAMKAGLKSGDVILQLDNEKLATPSEFSEAIRSRTVGEVVTLAIKMATGSRTMEVKLGKKPME